MVKILSFILVIHSVIQSQNFYVPNNDLIKGIIYIENKLLFETEDYLLEVRNMREGEFLTKTKDSDENHLDLDSPFHLVKVEDKEILKDNSDKVSFQQHHNYKLFFEYRDKNSLFFSDCAKAILKLLIFNDFSTTDSHYFTFIEKIP